MQSLYTLLLQNSSVTSDFICKIINAACSFPSRGTPTANSAQDLFLMSLQKLNADTEKGTVKQACSARFCLVTWNSSDVFLLGKQNGPNPEEAEKTEGRCRVKGKGMSQSKFKKIGFLGSGFLREGG